MSTVTVRHAQGSYPVYVEPGLAGRLEELVGRHLPDRRVAMIADRTVHELYKAGRLGGSRWEPETLTFPAGERSKTRETWSLLTDQLLRLNFGRDSGIVALGGGVAGDLAGFVAATYLRGVPYLQVPTSLLAMLDASVGGKTAVDTAEGKNLIGAFHPPVAVLADPGVLGTLPDREYRAGLAEAVKHGLIADLDYFEWMERQAEQLLAREAGAVEHLVRRSVEIKAQVVSEDERETGRRAILNAGHTVAHAIERATQYRVLHGEAVGLGLVAETALATGLGVASPEAGARVVALLERLGLPTRVPEPVGPDRLLAAMGRDKKNRGGGIRFALPRAVGRMGPGPDWTTEAAEATIVAALHAIS
ncbi:MAG: 3-dehydroquinate synthase [Gemmatimonadales bacterium]|nr:3-dehydroquinate synthase [Gemmatimonadales bacterium]